MMFCGGGGGLEEKIRLFILENKIHTWVSWLTYWGRAIDARLQTATSSALLYSMTSVHKLDAKFLFYFVVLKKACFIFCCAYT